MQRSKSDKKETPPKRGVGRPKAGGTSPMRWFRLGDGEWGKIVAAAERSGLSTADWIRGTLSRAAGLTPDRPG